MLIKLLLYKKWTGFKAKLEVILAANRDMTRSQISYEKN